MPDDTKPPPTGTHVDLKHDGLLWWINSAVFHPIGYALSVTPHDPGGPHEFVLLGDGSEPWHFGYEEGELDALFAKCREAMRRAGADEQGTGSLVNPESELEERVRAAESMALRLAEALRLTREYVGEEALPAIEGWSWYDALEAYKAATPGYEYLTRTGQPNEYADQGDLNPHTSEPL